MVRLQYYITFLQLLIGMKVQTVVELLVVATEPRLKEKAKQVFRMPLHYDVAMFIWLSYEYLPTHIL